MASRTRLRPRRARILLVTGASGFLGRHLVNGPATAGWEIVAPSAAALDVRKRDLVIETVRDWHPTAIAHLAYRKHDRRSIVDGSRNVAEAATAAGARLVHLSSDAVFPGQSHPYVEDDQPFPINDYGRHKLDAERAVAEACPDAVMIRTSLLYGIDDLAQVQRDVVDAIHTRSVVTFFTDEIRCPAHVDDVADAVAQLADMHGVAGPLHVAGPDALSRAEFAVRTALMLGLDPSLVRTGTMTDAGIVRPGRVVLDSTLAAALGIRCRPVY